MLMYLVDLLIKCIWFSNVIVFFTFQDTFMSVACLAAVLLNALLSQFGNSTSKHLVFTFTVGGVNPDSFIS